MRKYIYILALAAALMTAGCTKKDNISETTAAVTEAVIETTKTQETEYVEYVSDEDWNNLIKVYNILRNNYPAAKELLNSGVTKGSENAQEIIKKAEETLEFGKTCEREGLTSEEAFMILDEMVTTTDSLLALLVDNDIPLYEETTEPETETIVSEVSSGEDSNNTETEEAEEAEETKAE